MPFTLWDQEVDAGSFFIFQRVRSFYRLFAFAGSLVAAVSVTALSLPEFHPATSTLASVSEGLLCSSTITSTISAVTAVMLLFRFEGVEQATRGDSLVAWLPLVFLDVSVLEFLVAMVCWYWDKSPYRGAFLVCMQFIMLLCICITLATWMWFSMKNITKSSGRKASIIDMKPNTDNSSSRGTTGQRQAHHSST